MPAPMRPAKTIAIDVVPAPRDRTYGWRVRITSRDAKGKLVAVRNLRAISENEATARADMLRGRNARDDIANEGRPA